MRKLKKSEYPEKIVCLAVGCPACPYCPKGFKYKDCKAFSWKEKNGNKYKIEVENGKITKVFEL